MLAGNVTCKSLSFTASSTGNNVAMLGLTSFTGSVQCFLWSICAVLLQGAPAMLGNGQAEQLKQLNGEQTVSKKKLALCLNLRDVGATMPDKLRTGMVFRSSQLLRYDFNAADNAHWCCPSRRRVVENAPGAAELTSHQFCTWVFKLDAICLLLLLPLCNGYCFLSMMCCSGEDMKRYGVQTVLDLRRMDRPCKKKGKKIDQIRLAGRYVQKVCPRLAIAQCCAHALWPP